MVTSSGKKGPASRFTYPPRPPAASMDAPSGTEEETPLVPTRILVMDDQAPIRMVPTLLRFIGTRCAMERPSHG